MEASGCNCSYYYFLWKSSFCVPFSNTRQYFMEKKYCTISLLKFFSFRFEWRIINRFVFTLWRAFKKNTIGAQNMAKFQKFMRNLSVHHLVTPSFCTNKKLLIIINLLWKYQSKIMWTDVITLWIYFFLALYVARNIMPEKRCHYCWWPWSFLHDMENRYHLIVKKFQFQNKSKNR